MTKGVPARKRFRYRAERRRRAKERKIVWREHAKQFQEPVMPGGANFMQKPIIV